MSNDDILTDDYVAGLLSKEANDCSLKYSALGMEAFRTKKPTNTLKPNTRFLRHIIKNTDSHNKALLAKEAAESRARLADLEYAEEVKRRKTNPNARDIRKRQMGDIRAILGAKRRKGSEDDEKPIAKREGEFSRYGSREHGSTLGAERDQDLVKARNDSRRHHGRLSKMDDDQEMSKEPSERRKRRDDKPGRSHDTAFGNGEERHDRRHRDRSRSPKRRRRSHSPEENARKHRHRSPLLCTKQTPRSHQKCRALEKDDNDSDPLDDLIGPAPPPRYRGRGALAGSSGIDRRFSETYDPKLDVPMEEPEGNDWDDAVEAFRDRQKLKQNQEQRLKAAGFADDQINKAKGATDVDGADVRWSKLGEKREWDRGKSDSEDEDAPSGLFLEQL